MTTDNHGMKNCNIRKNSQICLVCRVFGLSQKIFYTFVENCDTNVREGKTKATYWSSLPELKNNKRLMQAMLKWDLLNFQFAIFIVDYSFKELFKLFRLGPKTVLSLTPKDWQLPFSIICFILLAWYFPGWVGGWGQVNIKDQQSWSWGWAWQLKMEIKYWNWTPNWTFEIEISKLKFWNWKLETAMSQEKLNIEIYEIDYSEGKSILGLDFYLSTRWKILSIILLQTSTFW